MRTVALLAAVRHEEPLSPSACIWIKQEQDSVTTYGAIAMAGLGLVLPTSQQPLLSLVFAHPCILARPLHSIDTTRRIPTVSSPD